MSVTVARQTELDRTRFFINGDWVKPQGTETIRALEAATGEPLGTAAMGSAADIDTAVLAARAALAKGPWGRTTPAERAEIMLRFAERLAARADATAQLVSRENGMPMALSPLANGAAPVGLLHMYARLITGIALEEIRPSEVGATIVRREPVGVVGAITAWNYPQLLAMVKIAPALAAGCTVVLKPSPETALDSYVLGEAAREAGLPPGVLNIVLAGPEAGAALVSHPEVDKIAFTGSTPTGRLIGAECGRLVRRVTLELGGKSASLFLDDGNLQTFLTGLAGTTFMNNSQTCTAQARILVARSRYAEVVEALAEHTRDLVVGDPLDERTQIGPMASEHQLARVLSYIDAARDSGARLVSGGGRPKNLDRGWFVEPTVFADVDNSDRLAREEVFGPVLAVIPFDGDDEAVAIANDSNYGLGGSVFTTDEERGIDVARRIRTGTIGVNYYALDAGSPFGGMKDSGIGRELGPEALDAYLEYKSIYVSADRL
ncbi:aldehyde dehydrogenase [Amycolatopsis rhizosphaerae]|uniref:Aldehyde dehydrogenase n=1 Tax=Amycolatopsis rhizosphaerae TaxID=2053003 RepID=A0A558CYT4_9PSEU|nr:aldehyde dehydrogenase [Amycolatopsis rhizosphaerae]TVT53936.1 aldehyde dehydrogenase [Amycolatopsis rhizosphaerae]